MTTATAQLEAPPEPGPITPAPTLLDPPYRVTMAWRSDGRLIVSCRHPAGQLPSGVTRKTVIL